ncbi:hypothetical protein A1D28_06665 [Pasteurella multocida]|nr:hypothetical protein [Pasteurella multocida]
MTYTILLSNCFAYHTITCVGILEKHITKTFSYFLTFCKKKFALKKKYDMNIKHTTTYSTIWN